MKDKIRVVLTDDHPVVRQGIRSLLEKGEDIAIVGEASTGEETIQMVKELRPDVLLLDVELPDIPGPHLAQQLQQLNPDMKILALSAHDDAVYIQGLLEIGASGYLMKEEVPEVILEAVRGVAQGQKGWLSRRISARIASWMEEGVSEKPDLSLRELEVLHLIVNGKTNQAIANDLAISEKTVEKYIRGIFTKLNVTSRVEAAVYAVRERLV